MKRKPHKSVETTETLNYMGLNGKKELVLITDKHHFVLSPDKEIIRTHQEQIFALLDKWTTKYPETALQINNLTVGYDGKVRAFLS